MHHPSSVNVFAFRTQEEKWKQAMNYHNGSRIVQKQQNKQYQMKLLLNLNHLMYKFFKKHSKKLTKTQRGRVSKIITLSHKKKPRLKIIVGFSSIGNQFSDHNTSLCDSIAPASWIQQISLHTNTNTNTSTKIITRSIFVNPAHPNASTLGQILG